MGITVRFAWLSVMAIALLAGPATAFADAESASLMTFETCGPDCYADGMQVLDGEYYALVWQANAAEAVSFTMAGEPVDASVAQVLRVLPRAQGGRCLATTFSVDQADLANYKKGALRLYLLDTRVYAGGVAAVGGIGRVQASVPVTEGLKVENRSSTGEVRRGLYSASALTDEIRTPSIAGISVKDGQVTLLVKNTMAGVNYTALDAERGAVVAEAKPATGSFDAEETIQVVVPCGTSGTRLFRVGRK